MVDFNSCKKLSYVIYGGEDGPKRAVDYTGEWYMLKFPSHNKYGTVTDPVSEYIGSKIFNIAGIDVQDVMLGTYSSDDKTRIVCACRDFTDHDSWRISNILMISNAILTLHQGGRSKHELSYILDIIDMQHFIDTAELKQRFWDMFIVDALIANRDRNIYNWGLMYDQDKGETALCPVYDCGSSLDVNDTEQNTSVFREDGKRIEYLGFIRSGKYDDCTTAAARIIPNIDMEAISDMIREITCLSDKEKKARIDFLRTRYESIKFRR